jgi:hypothetical protein
VLLIVVRRPSVRSPVLLVSLPASAFPILLQSGLQCAPKCVEGFSLRSLSFVSFAAESLTDPSFTLRSKLAVGPSSLGSSASFSSAFS